MRARSRRYGLRDWLISTGWIWVIGVAFLVPWLGRAQQTSYSIPLQPGFNSIANHLVNGSNKLDEILRAVPDGSALYKFNPATQTYDTAQFLSGYGWFPEMEFLNPGEGAFLYVNAASVVTFSGAIAPFALPRQAIFGAYNFISAHEPRNMSFAELFGFPPAHGDVVYLYDEPLAARPDQIGQYASSIHKFTTPQGWDNIAPTFKRGRSAFVFLSRAPRIMVHPKSQPASAGQTLRLDVSMLTSDPYTYQWQLNDDDIPGETNSVLALGNIQFLQAGLYSVTVSNPFGDATSKPASIRVSSEPVILEPPQPLKATPAQMVELRVRAVGTPTLRYRWYQNNRPLPNGTEATLKQTATQSAYYHVMVTNNLGFAQSEPVLVEVNDPPSITQQPVSVTVFPHQNATFTVAAKGTPPLRYQWRRNGQNVMGENSPTLVISNAQPTDGGLYQAAVANVAGVAYSDLAELNVVVPPIFLADRFEQSELYTMPIFTGAGSNLQASNEIDEVKHCGREGGSSVWLRWMTPQQGIVRFETSGSSFDTVIAAYTMDAAGRLIDVACDDDEGEFLGSRMRFVAEPDTMYHIAIDGLDGARGKILLDWELIPTLERLPKILEQPRDQTAVLDSQTQGVVFQVVAADNPTSYQWYHNGVQLPGENRSRLVLPFVTREDLGYYFVDVFQDRQSVRSRRALLQVSLADMDGRLLQAFAVDKFADAFARPVATGPLLHGGIQSVAGTAFTPVLGYTGTQIFSTVGFSGEPGELSHCGIPGGSSAWFTFVPATNGQLYLNTAGSSFNTVLAVYTGPGPTLASLTAVICDDDSGPGATSSLSFSATGGTKYYIAVDGYNGVTGTAQLDYRLLVPMMMTRISKTNETVCRFRITATPSYPFTVQRCSGFQTWTSVLTTNSSTGTYDYRDTNATPVRRFYRAIQTP